MKRIIFFNLLIIILLSSYSVQSQCPNLNFSNGSLSNWQCYAGNWTNSNFTINPSNPISGRHTIMNGAQLLRAGELYDEQCPKIKKVPDGFAYSARIGNDQNRAEIDAIEYTLTVDSNNSLLIVHFAFVMRYDSNYSPEEQAQFSIIIKDSAGNPVENLSCSEINFTASANLTDLTSNDNILVHDWTTVGYNLEHLIGKTIKIYFETRDCTMGDHFAYAYVVAECRPTTINLTDCEYCNHVLRFRAPDGFKRYTWTRSSKPDWSWSGEGRNYQNLALGDIQNDEVFTCQVESILGCSAVVKTIVKRTLIDAKFLYGIKENGGVDFGSNDNRNWYDTCNRTVTFVDLSTITNSKLQSRSWKIHGLEVTSKDSLFTYTFPNPENDPVTYLIRLTLSAENGCTDTSKTLATHYITIYPTSDLSVNRSKTFLAEKKDTLTAVFKNISSFQWSWELEDGSIATNTSDNPLIVKQTGTYWIDAWAENGCHYSDTLYVTDLETFFQFGIADEIGHVDFESNNNQNWYDTCNRTVTFVDLSTLYNTKIKSRTWTIEGINTIFTDSIFTFQFPNLHYSKTYSIYLTITTENNDIQIFEYFITIYPSPEVNILQSNTWATKGIETLTPAVKIGNIVSYLWSLNLTDGTTGTNTSKVLIVNQAGTYILTAEDDRGCFVKYTITFEQNVYLKERISTRWNLGQNIPNPAKNITRIPYSIPNDGNVEFTLYSIAGQSLHTEIVSSVQGDNELEFNVSGLSSGIYFYSLIYNNQQLTRKMVVKK